MGRAAVIRTNFTACPAAAGTVSTTARVLSTHSPQSLSSLPPSLSSPPSMQRQTNSLSK